MNFRFLMGPAHLLDRHGQLVQGDRAGYHCPWFYVTRIQGIHTALKLQESPRHRKCQVNLLVGRDPGDDGVRRHAEPERDDMSHRSDKVDRLAEESDGPSRLEDDVR